MNKDFIKQITKSAAQVVGQIHPDRKEELDSANLDEISDKVQTLLSGMMGSGDMQGLMGNLMAGAGAATASTSTAAPVEHHQSSRRSKKSSGPKKVDIEYDLECELSELYRGAKKKISVRRKRLDKKGNVVDEKNKLSFTVEPGMEDGQVVRFKGEGDHLPGRDPGDIIITIRQIEDDKFERESANLIVEQEISLGQVYGGVIEIDMSPLCDNVFVKVSDTDNLLLNHGVRKIPGRGMPVHGSPGEFGDLFVEFSLQLDPERVLTSEEREWLVAKFPSLVPVSGTPSKVVDLENVSEEELMEYFGDILEESDQESGSEDLEDIIEESDELSDE